MLPSSSTLASGSTVERKEKEKRESARLGPEEEGERDDDLLDSFLPPKPSRVSVPKKETECRFDCLRSNSLASSTSEVGWSSSPTETSSKTFWKLEEESRKRGREVSSKLFFWRTRTTHWRTSSEKTPAGIPRVGEKTMPT